MDKILLVEDDETICSGVKLLLELQGYNVDIATNGIEGIKKYNESYSLVIMDIMMPQLSGIEACKRLREESCVPVLFLTAKSSEIDKMQAFEDGGDDYLVKPFSNLELISRVKALIRRRNVYDKNDIDKYEKDKFVECSGVKVYINQNRIEVDGNDVKLTTKEYEILKLFIQQPDRVFTIENIYTCVWEEDFAYNSKNTVMVHIKNLRNKLLEVCGQAVIGTVWGKGYKFER